MRKAERQKPSLFDFGKMLSVGAKLGHLQATQCRTVLNGEGDFVVEIIGALWQFEWIVGLELGKEA